VNLFVFERGTFRLGGEAMPEIHPPGGQTGLMKTNEEGVALTIKRISTSVGISAGVILGVIFLVAGVRKVPVQTDAYTILLVIRKEWILLWLSDYVHIIVPLVEIILGFLLISGVAARLTALASAVMVGLFIFNNIWLIRKGVDQDSCHCFGDAITRFLGGISNWGALYIDFAMLGLVFLILAFHPNKWWSLRPWPLRNRSARGIRL
jgi:uncharacterized membrane protein YphA (DoxX/SURF4 family)